MCFSTCRFAPVRSCRGAMLTATRHADHTVADCVLCHIANVCEAHHVYITTPHTVYCGTPPRRCVPHWDSHRGTQSHIAVPNGDTECATSHLHGHAAISCLVRSAPCTPPCHNIIYHVARRGDIIAPRCGSNSAVTLALTRNNVKHSVARHNGNATQQCDS